LSADYARHAERQMNKKIALNHRDRGGRSVLVAASRVVADSPDGHHKRARRRACPGGLRRQRICASLCLDRFDVRGAIAEMNGFAH